MNDMRDLPPAVSVVVPVRNEAGNIAPLVEEIATALGSAAAFEIDREVVWQLTPANRVRHRFDVIGQADE